MCVCVCVCVGVCVCIRLSARRFRQLVERLLQFISTRLFPAEPDELPPLSKCSWWIPSATKVLGLFSECLSLSHKHTHTHTYIAHIRRHDLVHLASFIFLLGMWPAMIRSHPHALLSLRTHTSRSCDSGSLSSVPRRLVGFLCW